MKTIALCLALTGCATTYPPFKPYNCYQLRGPLQVKAQSAEQAERGWGAVDWTNQTQVRCFEYKEYNAR